MAPSRYLLAERRLLSACLRVGRPGRGLARLVTADLDWIALLDMAGSQLLAQTLWQALLEEDAGQLVPPAVLETLRKALQSSTAANALLLHDLARVQALLEQAGVASVALKGSALVAAYYPSIGARHVGDIDLLVRPADLEAACGALERAGLRPPAGQLPSVASHVGAAEARAPGGDHLPPLSTWGGVILELHDRAPGGGPSPDEIVARSRRLEWKGRSLVIPGPLDLAGMACLHTLIKHRSEWRLRARLVADLHAIETAGPIDWDQVRALYVEGAGAIDDSLALLEAASRLASGGDRPAPRLGFLEAPPARRLLSDRLRTTRDGLAKALAEGGQSAVARIFFPTRRYMEARYGLRPGSPAVWLLYPWRVVRGAVVTLFRKR